MRGKRSLALLFAFVFVDVLGFSLILPCSIRRRVLFVPDLACPAGRRA